MTNEEQRMSKEKQIEEIANDINMHCCSLAEQFCGETSCNACLTMFLYNAGYRKQSEGEWVKDNASQFKHRYNCSVCDYRFLGIPTTYCPNCGARMKGD